MEASSLSCQLGHSVAQLLQAAAAAAVAVGPLSLHQQKWHSPALVQPHQARLSGFISPTPSTTTPLGIEAGYSGSQLSRLGGRLYPADFRVVEAHAQPVDLRDEAVKLGAIPTADQVQTGLVLQI